MTALFPVPKMGRGDAAFFILDRDPGGYPGKIIAA